MDLQRILNSPADVYSPRCQRDTETASGDLRVGKWSPEEERYAAALITHFMDGVLSVAPGTSLRSFLADRLRCSAMRVSTKLSMDAIDGQAIPRRLGQKRFFPRGDLSASQRHGIEREIRRLEQAFCHVENLDERSDDDDASATRVDCHGDVSPQRIGSWSHEEQAYASALIDAFLRGHVNLDEGVTLRAYLSDRLCCNPMRISKKLATGKVAAMAVPKRLGSTVYHRQTFDVRLLAHTEWELDTMRRTCFPTMPQPVPQQTVVVTPPARRTFEGVTLDSIDPTGSASSIETANKKRRVLPSLSHSPSSPSRLPSLALHLTRPLP